MIRKLILGSIATIFFAAPLVVSAQNVQLPQTCSPNPTQACLQSQVQELVQLLRQILLAHQASTTPAAPTSSSSCIFNGQTMQTNSSVTAYEFANVHQGTSCVSQVRTCDNGILSGTYSYSSCTVATAPAGPTCNISATPTSITTGQNALLSWTTTGAVSASLSGINPATIGAGTFWPAGSLNVSPSVNTTYVLTATSGSGTSAQCSATVNVSAPAVTSCTFNGQTVGSGASVSAYLNATVPYGSSCSDASNMQTRTCTNGVLSGTFTNPGCTVQSAPAPAPTPTASLTANGQTNITANVGDSITYVWSGTNGTASSELAFNGGASQQWVDGSGNPLATTLSGTVTGVVPPAQAGSTYTITYIVTPSSGQPATSSIMVQVNPLAFSVGGRVEATQTLNVRNAASASAPIVATEASGSLGTIAGGPTVADGYTWWQTNWDDGSNGWSVGQYLTQATTGAGSCSVSGATLSSGQSQTFYSAQTAPSGQTCASVSQSRTCVNGSLNGSSNYSYLSCTAQPQSSSPSPNTFQILVDINFLDASSAAQATLFAADGIWGTDYNSPQGINWANTYNVLNANVWTVSEDLASWTGGSVPTATQNNYSTISSQIGRLVDGAFFYNESAASSTAQTALTDAQIATYDASTVPGLGALGSRIIVLNRTYQTGNAYTASFQHALLNPDVSGGVFEVSPNFFAIPTLDFAAGCKYILSLGKKCYFLLPPGSNDGQEAPQNTTNYLGDVQQFINYLAQSGGLLTNPNLYIVLPVYNQPNPVHYVSTSPNDPDSIESVVDWLKSYQADMPSVTPLPTDQGRPPRGSLDSTSNYQAIAGWAQDPDTPDWPIAVTYYIDAGTSDATSGAAYANLSRSDLCTAIGSCNHAFSFSVPQQYCDGKTHTISVYGIDSTIIGTNNAQLTGSPSTFECGTPQQPPVIPPTPPAVGGATPGFNEAFLLGYAESQGVTCTQSSGGSAGSPVDCPTNLSPMTLPTIQAALTSLKANGVDTQRDVVPAEVMANPAFYPLAATVLQQYQQNNFTLILGLGLPLPTSALVGDATPWCPAPTSDTNWTTEANNIASIEANFFSYLKNDSSIDQTWLSSHVIVEPFNEFDSLNSLQTCPMYLTGGSPQRAAVLQSAIVHALANDGMSNEVTAPSIVNTFGGTLAGGPPTGTFGKAVLYLQNYYADGGQGVPNVHLYYSTSTELSADAYVQTLESGLSAINSVLPAQYQGTTIIGETGYADQDVGSAAGCTIGNGALDEATRAQVYNGMALSPVFKADASMILFWRLFQFQNVPGFWAPSGDPCEAYFGVIEPSAWTASPPTMSYTAAGTAIFDAIQGKQTPQSGPPSCTLNISDATFSAGQPSATLSWTTANGISASIDNNIGSVSSIASSSMTITPAPGATYIMTVQGSGGQTSTCQASPGTITLPATRDQFITSLYECVLGRNPETSVTYWDTQNGLTIPQVYHDFFDSAEYINDNTSDTKFMEQMYECIQFRFPSPTEEAAIGPTWTGQLETQAARDTELDSVLASPEFGSDSGPALVQATGYALAATAASFTVGEPVEVTQTVNVRSSASLSATLLGQQASGALGFIAAGPTSADGYNWWRVNYNSGPTGWNIDSYEGTPMMEVAPTASLTANSQSGTVTVAPGATVSYAVANTDCASVSTTYTDNGGASQPWDSGISQCSDTDSTGGVISAAQAGHTYVFTYTVTSSGGLTASASVTVAVSGQLVQPVQQYGDSSNVLDWMLKSICVDGNNDPVPADPYYQCPPGTTVRKIQVNDPLPYYNIDQADIQRSDSFPLLDANGNVLYFHTFDYPPYNEFNLYDGSDGYDIWTTQDGWFSASETRDGGGYGQVFYGANCTLGDGWIFFPTSGFLTGGGTQQPIAGQPWEHLLQSSPGTCSQAYTNPYTDWSFEQNVPFGGINGNPGKIMDAMVSIHGIDPTLPITEQHLEEYYFTQQYGLTEWVAWYPASENPTPTTQCINVPATLTYRGETYVAADCHDWSNVQLATTPTIPEWPLPPANLLQHSHFDDGGGYYDNSQFRTGVWQRGGDSVEGNLINWSLEDSTTPRDTYNGELTGVRYLATNCGGTCTGPSVQEIYQDLPISSFVNNGTYLFGIDARSESGTGTIQVTVQEISSNYSVLWTDSVQGIVSPDNGNTTNPPSVYLTAAFIHKLTTIPIKPGAAYIQFSITPITSNTFDIVDAWLNRFPTMNTTTFGTVAVAQPNNESNLANALTALRSALSKLKSFF